MVPKCPSGGIGRRTGLKILRVLKLVPVQVRPWAPYDVYNYLRIVFFFQNDNVEYLVIIVFLLTQKNSSCYNEHVVMK